VCRSAGLPPEETVSVNTQGPGRTAAVALACGLLATALLVPPAVADEHVGTVTATVTVAEAAEACITVAVDSIDFGTLGLSATSEQTEPYAIDSCAAADQDILVAGTGAVSVDESSETTWALVEDVESEEDVNEYVVTFRPEGFQGDAPRLTTEAQLAETLSGETDGFTVTHRLFTPVEGSDGAGETMTFDIIWTAVLAE
jgi:hypothetical protein